MSGTIAGTDQAGGTASRYVLSGHVRHHDGSPAPGVTVSVAAKRLRSAVALGETTTGAAGEYRVEYPAPGTSLDLVLRAALDGHYVEEIRTGVSADEQLDVTLPGDVKPEYDTLLADVSPLLDGTEIADVAERHDYSYLARATGRDATRIEYLAEASRHAAATGLAAEQFYGLLRQGLPIELSTLAQRPPGELTAALVAAADANVIASADGAAEFAATLRDLEIKAAVNPPDGTPLSPVGELFAAAIPDARAREHAFRAYLDLAGDLEDFWQALARDPATAARADRLRLVLELGTLTGNDAALVGKLLAKFDRNELTHPRELVKLRDEWEELIDDVPHDLRAALTANDEPLEDQVVVRQYARTLSDRVAEAYPTADVAHLLSVHPEHAQAPSTRFLAGNPEFDLVRTPVNADTVPDADARQELGVIQRTFKITQAFDSMQALRDNGFDSSYAVASIDKDAFARQVSGALSRQEAYEVHARATHVHATAVNLVADLRTAGQFDVPWLPSSGPLTTQIPNWEELFGPADYPAVKECRTVYSEAAYLVDLLNYLKRLGAGVPPRPGGSPDGPVADALYVRRDDVRDVELSCDNTNLTVPYVDLVNELLESAVAPDTAVPATRRQTSGDAASLRVQPQHVNPGAYDKLAEAVYPWNLPFDLWREQTVASLAHLGVQRETLVETLGSRPFSANLLTDERLGLNTVAAKIISGELLEPVRSLAQYYGLPAGADPVGRLSVVRALLDAGSLRYAELEELLDTRFVNPGKSVRIQPHPQHPYDTDYMTLPGLDLATLDRLHRFVRLQRTMDLSVSTLDRVLSGSHSGGRLDRAALRGVAAVRRLSARLDLPMERVLAFYNPLETHAYTADTEAPLYDRLFLDPAVVTAEPNPFILRADRSELLEPGSLTTPSVAAALLGVLQVTDEELAALTTGPRAVTETQVLNLANLSALVRTVTLARALSLSISDLLRLVELHGEGAPFAAPTRTAGAQGDTEPAAGRPMVVDSGGSLPGYEHGFDSELGGGAPVRPPTALDGPGELPPVDALIGITERFLDAVAAIQAAGFTVADLDSLLADIQHPGGVVPEDIALTATLGTLRSALQAVYQQTAQTVDEKGDLTRKALALLGWDAQLAQDAVATLLGTVTYTADLAALPDGVEFPGDIPIRYQPDEKRLRFTGPMTDAQHNTLKGLNTVDQAYLAAVEAIYDEPRDFVAHRMKALRVPVYAAPLAAMPADLELPKAFAGKIFFDVSDHTLKSRGYLTAADAEALVHATKDPGFHKAVGDLRENQEAPIDDGNKFLTRGDAEDFFKAELPPAERFGRVLAFVNPILRRTLSETTVKQQLGQAAGLDAATADLLLGTWLRSATGSIVLQDFLQPRFVGSDPAVPIGRTTFSDQFKALALVYRAGLVLRKLRVTAQEVPFVFGQAAVNGWLDVNTLPSVPISGASPLFGGFIRLLELIRLRDTIPGGARTLSAVFTAARTPDATTSRVVTELAARTGWNATDLTGIATLLGLVVPAGFADEAALLALVTGVRLIQRLGVSADRVVPWLAADLTPEAAQAAWLTAKAQHTAEDWAGVATPMADALREHRRSALVSYLVANPRLAGDGLTPEWRDADGLHDYFLLDVEMGPLQQTTRIAQAIYSVQLFVQRCLLNLENQVTATDTDLWAQWEWMKQYRLWEANQKVFLYPENYFEPDLRADKSSFFAELETELIQQDVSDQSVETALGHYLDKLDEVARLQPCGIYNAYDDATRLHTLYVVARSESTPRTHYFRVFVNSKHWTPWEKIDLDIDAETVTPVVWNNDLYLLWPTFKEVVQATEIDMPGQGDKLKVPPATRRIQLNWSRRTNGRWEPKRISRDTIDVGYEGPWSVTLRAEPYNHWRPGVGSATDLVVYCVLNYDILIPAGTWTGYTKNMRYASFTLSSRRGLISTRPLELIRVLDYEDIQDPTWRPDTLVIYPPLGTHGYGQEFVSGGDSRGHNGELWIQAPSSYQANPTWIRLLDRVNSSTPFRILYQYQMTALFGGSAYWSHQFYSDASRIYLLRPGTKGIRFTTFYHPHVESMKGLLDQLGLDGLFNRELQVNPGAYSGHFDFRGPYGVPEDTKMDVSFPDERMEFEPEGAYAGYNWELFFHSPLLMAGRLSANQRFAEAQRWFHQIFDPTDRSGTGGPQRFWRTKPFFETTSTKYQAERIEAILQRLATGTTEDAAVDAWLNNPFQPDVVARLRTTAYQKAVVMKYLDNLIAWADRLFRQDTLESINQAAQLYVLAAQLLGRRPDEVTDKDVPPRSYRQLNATPAAALAITEAENLVPHATTGLAPALAPGVGLGWLQYFRIPRNEKLAGYWDTVADRLFKIRNSQNIDGVTRMTALFGPPIDPSLLVRATSAGVSLADVIDDITAPMPHYRFGPILAKAKELANEVKAFGGALLSALEKRDTEALGRLRSSHEQIVLTAARAVRQQQITEATDALAAAQLAKSITEDKKQYYSGKNLMNDKEKAHTRLAADAVQLQEIAAAIDMTVSVLALLPELKAGFPTTIGASFGGSNLGGALKGVASSLQSIAGTMSSRGSLAATLGGYDHRLEDWRFQAAQAELESRQHDSQIAAAEVRKAIAEAELANHDKQIANAKEADRFLYDKYTNKELYDWMAGQLSTSYFQAYQLAHDVAKRAERAYRHEVGVQDSNFVKFGYWDSLHKGLLAGERLSADLNRMDAAFLEANAREFELSKRVSLAQLDPKALLSLKETGRCFVSLPEALFDLDTPGHYMRRLKNVSITVPCVAGPYTGVNLTATLLRSTVRVDPRLSGNNYARQNADTRFRDHSGPIQSIVTSTGQEDSGLFETNLRDERFLPFEGAGAVSEWQLSLPDEFRQFDYESITDVVMHLRYTARDGGSTLAKPAIKQLTGAITNWVHAGGGKGLFRAFSARREFPDRWHRFLTDGTGRLTFTISKSRFPYLFRGNQFSIDDPQVVLVLSHDPVPDGSKRYVDCYSTVKAKLAAPGIDPRDTDLIADPMLGKLPRAGYSGVTVELKQTEQDWVVTVPPSTLDSRLFEDGRFNPDAVLDLLLICHYTLKEQH